MEKKLILTVPKESDEKDWKEYIDEFAKSNPESHPLDFRAGDDYKKWLEKKETERIGKNLEEGRVPSSVYFLKEKRSERILAHLSIRHSIDNEFLSRVGGHIGYGTRPSERGKGYATKLLGLALEECKKLGIKNPMITCKRNNLPSAKCIKNNGGKLRDEIEFNGEEFNRYDFDLEKKTEKKGEEK